MTIPGKRPSPGLYLAPADELPSPLRPTMFQEDAARFATTQQQYADQERNAEIREAVKLLGTKQPGRVQYVVMRSFIRQARILGLGYAVIEGQPYEAGGPLS